MLLKDGGYSGPEYDRVLLPPVEHAVQIVITGAAAGLEAASLVPAGDLVAVMLPVPGVTPTPGDRLRMDGRVYVLQSIKAVRANPDGAVLHFVLHGRA